MPTPLASICKKLCENQFLLSIILTQFGFLLLILSHSIALYVAICIISFAISSTLPLLIKEIGIRNQDNKAYSIAIAGYTFFSF
ncbi:hypothetical protein COM11_22870 [Bacillus pseudomycoides]|uniref:hypothetical protein n=1 Tax=Bacillus pseudomycoides TaxID=64104 RepID=UPI000BF777A9|nr:hypothetical protein [Bacillus pseudomycoides]PGC25652.1 hypothetical protein COM11_22870 [Bacillus pseudomycoides]